MAMFSPLQTNLNSSSNQIQTACNSISPSQLLLRQLYKTPRNSFIASRSHGDLLLVRAYMEDPSSVSGFANKVIGALPIIGLVARIFSDEGGVGGDIIDFAEFRRRVGKRSSVNDSSAFYGFEARHGKAGKPQYVLMCCWLAAVGAGLLKSEEILEGVVRLRLSDDIEFEEENFIAMMNEAREKRAKLGVATPSIPMEIRAEKALEAIYICCFGREPIYPDDLRDLSVMLNAVFPTVGQSTLHRIVKEKAQRVTDGVDEITIPEPKPLPKEAVELQMKDLQFLRDGGDV